MTLKDGGGRKKHYILLETLYTGTGESSEGNFMLVTTLPCLVIHTKDEVIILGLQLSVPKSLLHKVNKHDSQKLTLCKSWPNKFATSYSQALKVFPQ